MGDAVVPPPTATRRVGRTGEHVVEHHGVGAARDGLGDVAAGAQATLGEHVAVDARLVEVAHARRPRVGHRGGEPGADPELAGDLGARPHDDAGGAGAHEVERALVARAPTDEDGQLEAADERLEVERRLDRLAHVLGGHQRSDDGEQVGLGLEQVRRERLDLAGRHGDDAGGARRLDLLDPGLDQLGLHRRGVGITQTGERPRARRRGRRRPATPATPPDRRAGSRGPRGARSRRRRSRASTAAVAGDETASLGAASTGAPKRKASISHASSTFSASRVRRVGTRDDLVEPVGPAGRLAHADLDVGHSMSSWEKATL